MKKFKRGSRVRVTNVASRGYEQYENTIGTIIGPSPSEYKGNWRVNWDGIPHDPGFHESNLEKVNELVEDTREYLEAVT